MVTDPRRTRLTTLLELLPDLTRATAMLAAWAALITTIWTHQPYVAAAAATYLICIGLDNIVDAITAAKPCAHPTQPHPTHELFPDLFPTSSKMTRQEPRERPLPPSPSLREGKRSRTSSHQLFPPATPTHQETTMTTQPTYTHPKIAATIRAYLRRTPNPTYHDIRRDIHKHGGRIRTTLRELEANGEIYRHLPPQPGPPDTWHLTDTTPDTNPATNTTPTSETQPEQPLEGWLTEVNTGDIHPREAARLLDELFTRVATQPGWPGVSATLKLLGDLHRDLLVAAKGADRDYPEEASDEGENRATLCRCGHRRGVHEVGGAGCAWCGCDRFGRPADLEHGGERLTFAPIEGPGRLVTGVGGRRCIIDGTAGIFLEQPSGGVLHMPADGTETHVDPPGMPCRQHPLVVAIADNVDAGDPWDLPDLDRAVKVVAYLREHGGSIDELLADRSFEA